ncbi:MAG TPA: HAMP domain-containing sensor histidine kinase [Candidatus Paceibacterota bacterium]
MSKTFDANLMTEMAATYWKRFAALATDSLNRYRYDPFFRTECNVVGLQVAFAVVILGLVGTSFSLLYHDISEAIVQGIRESIASGTTQTLGPAIVAEIANIRTQNLITIISVIVLTTMLFGYVIARITLTPARNALAAQKQFIGNIAHELRTPLSVIKTNTEVALLDEHVTADMRNTLNSNVEELDRISEIINNLLSLSALVRPERIEFSTVDLSAIVTDVVKKFSQFAKHGEQQVTLRKSPDAHVWGNATALQQIVGNLLKNAITYTPRGGHIRITVEPALDNLVELIIQDSGIGIARKDLFRIFEPFYRADPSRTRGEGGSGLGLAIVSELIRMHQARITIRSSVGRGTTVSVLFPGAHSHAQIGNEANLKDGLSEIAVDFSNR